MWKLNKKTGTTLIEVVCALNIIAVFFIIVLSIQLNVLKLKKYNDQLMQYSAVLEAVKTELAANLTYSELILLNSENKIYLEGDKLNLSVLKNNNINNLFSKEIPESEPYLKMSVTSGTVLKVKLELQFKSGNKVENITSEFYKGNYL